VVEVVVPVVEVPPNSLVVVLVALVVVLGVPAEETVVPVEANLLVAVTQAA
jgi:hypothetical protein